MELTITEEKQLRLLEEAHRLSMEPTPSIEIYRRLKEIYNEGQMDAISSVSALCRVETSL